MPSPPVSGQPEIVWRLACPRAPQSETSRSSWIHSDSTSDHDASARAFTPDGWATLGAVEAGPIRYPLRGTVMINRCIPGRSTFLRSEQTWASIELLAGARPIPQIASLIVARETTSS